MPETLTARRAVYSALMWPQRDDNGDHDMNADKANALLDAHEAAVADREQQQLRDELAEARGILAVLRSRVDDAGSLMSTSYVRSALDGDDAIPEPRNPSSAP